MGFQTLNLVINRIFTNISDLHFILKCDKLF